MASFVTTATRIITLAGACAALGACALFQDRDTGPAEPVPVNTAESYNDGVEYPVRQPPPPPRDGNFQADTSGTTTIRPGSSSVRLRPDAPERYTVVRGDTLWDISGKFLRDPWLWPEIWQVNEQISNPHLIYPGDVLRLVWVDGQPRIIMDRGMAGTARLSPKIRVESLERAIDTIPYDAIAGFLSKPTVISKDELKDLPYILDIKEAHLVAGVGFTVYVRGTEGEVGSRYNVFNIGDIYRDPDTGKKLGYEALYVGTGRITQTGDPAKMLITESQREALRGDRLLLEETDIPTNFFPRAPEVVVDGTIISVVDGVQLIGQYQIVVLNRGEAHGIAQGHVLSIWQSGREAVDRWGKRGLFGFAPSTKVDLPEEQAGRLMVFRTDEEISYGLVLSATSEISVGDGVRNPR